MSVAEELHEHSEHAHDGFSRRAAATMAVIAAVLAIVAVSGHIMTTEELLMQSKASDQWAFYQAKALRRYQSSVAADLLTAMKNEGAAHTAEKYTANAERYEKEGEAIMEKAKEYQAESDLAGKRALRLHLGEIFLELAIVFSSLAILTRRNAFWVVGVSGAVVGVLISATCLLIRH